MRSFLLACVAIVAIGVGAHFVTERVDPPVAGHSDNPSVRLDATPVSGG